MVRRLFLRPVAVLLGAVCLINGCHSWKQEPVSAVSLNARPLAPARIRMMDGRQFVILQPRVVGDSLVGRIETDSMGPGPASLSRAEVSVRVAVSLAQVSSVQSRHLNGWKTAGLVWGLVLGLIAFHAATCSDDYFCNY